MVDTAYDADHLRQAIAAKGALAVIPNNPSRALKYPLDKHLYAQRHLVECCFSKLKQFRRVATRFTRSYRNYLRGQTLARRNRLEVARVHLPSRTDRAPHAPARRHHSGHLRRGQGRGGPWDAQPPGHVARRRRFRGRDHAARRGRG